MEQVHYLRGRVGFQSPTLMAMHVKGVKNCAKIANGAIKVTNLREINIYYIILNLGQSSMVVFGDC